MARPSLLQILREDGKLLRKVDVGLSELDLKRLYRLMILTRMIEVKGLILNRQGRLAFLAPSTGEEAAYIGSAYTLSPEDWIVMQYREPGAALVRGISVKEIFDQLIGNRNDLLKGRQMPIIGLGHKSKRMLHASPPVAHQIPEGVGIAMAMRLRGSKNVVLIYFGDGATSEGDFHTSMNFAGVFKAPVIFFCKNNQWAISTPVSRQTASEGIAIKSKAYGFDGILVDGNDLMAVYKATSDAVERARRGSGPTLIEAYTYRMGPHSTADDPSKYRDSEELELWRDRDPVLRLQKYLEGMGVLSQEEDKVIKAEANDEVEKAVKLALETSPPDPSSLFDDVYASAVWMLEEQAQDLMEVLSDG